MNCNDSKNQSNYKTISSDPRSLKKNIKTTLLDVQNVIKMN